MIHTRASKPATSYTIEAHRARREQLDFRSTAEYACACRGLLRAPERLELRDGAGRVVWSQEGFSFLDAPGAEACPADTVDPSLWRNSWLNHRSGLFEVVDGVYQVRGYDMANLTVIRGKTGWIVVDPLISSECARAAMDLIGEVLGPRPVSAVVVSQSHVDHFGGIRGVVDPSEVARGIVPLIVPEGFTHHCASENVHAMNVMQRRAAYQYGTMLPQGPRGGMAMGIGMGQSCGKVTFLQPTDEIREKTETRVIDGVTFEFLLTPGTEAPAEMCWFLPEYGALWMSELCSATMHNLYTLRGTQIRDGNAWALAIAEALVRFGSRAQVLFQAHNWPHWGNETVLEVLENTAAVYKFINDQALMYTNMGLTPSEISHQMRLPEAAEQVWYTRPYYGTLSHNVKAVYQKYIGWYDGNPVNLDPLTPSESARKLIEYVGSPERVLERAEADFERGEYQWCAQMANAVVFADPSNDRARYLCADALEQLGYQSESGPWRNCYLSAAMELRREGEPGKVRQADNSGDLARCMDSKMMLDFLGIKLDGEKAQHKELKLNLVLTDTGEVYYLHLYHGALLYYAGMQLPDPDATLTMPKLGLAALFTGNRRAQQSLIRVEGDPSVLDRLTEDLARFDRAFPIVEP